jgi:hypothetical protein
MTTEPTPNESTPTAVPEMKAGPVVRDIQANFTKAFLSQDRALYDATEKRYLALKALVAETRTQVCKAYDMATSGYVDATWLNGVERLVQNNPDSKRGRKAAPKPDNADLV